jgi:NhaP-type Na+/H+ or K+/H+ antiporter
MSISVGLIFGIICALLFKHFSFLKKTVVHENLVLLMCNYSSYLLLEMFNFSGILSLLICAVTCGHYAYYNLSEKA